MNHTDEVFTAANLFGLLSTFGSRGRPKISKGAIHVDILRSIHVLVARPLFCYLCTYTSFFMRGLIRQMVIFTSVGNIATVRMISQNSLSRCWMERLVQSVRSTELMSGVPVPGCQHSFNSPVHWSRNEVRTFKNGAPSGNLEG